jgi:hypothetical protein
MIVIILFMYILSNDFILYPVTTLYFSSVILYPSTEFRKLPYFSAYKTHFPPETVT